MRQEETRPGGDTAGGDEMREASIDIPRAEFDARAARLRAHVASEGMTGVVLFDRAYVLYFSGFAFIPTERPIAFVMNAQGEKTLFVPRLELEHAGSQTGFERVDHYLEYPDQLHPAEVLAKTLGDMGIRSKIAADTDGYP